MLLQIGKVQMECIAHEDQRDTKENDRIKVVCHIDRHRRLEIGIDCVGAKQQQKDRRDLQTAGNRIGKYHQTQYRDQYDLRCETMHLSSPVVVSSHFHFYTLFDTSCVPPCQ